VEVRPTQSAQLVEITLPTGRQVECKGQPCIIHGSRTLLGNITIRSMLPPQQQGKPPVEFGPGLPVVNQGQISFSKLVHDGQASLAGVQVRIQ
jgi:hypothetical protein